MTKNRVDMKMATVPSVTYLYRDKEKIGRNSYAMSRTFHFIYLKVNYSYKFLGEVYSLSVLVEEHSSPAWHEAWFSCEPQDDQDHKDDKHCALSKRHRTQLLIFILHHSVSVFVSLILRTAAKRLFKTGEKKSPYME